ncbi:hypothetical protein Hanom_Chr17g01589191 [Helianthus anomalus]
MFDYCSYQIPLSKFLIDILMFHEVHLSQMNPFSLAKVCQFELSYRGLGLKDWKDCFFLVDDRWVPVEMAWRSRRSSLPGPLPENLNLTKFYMLR